MATYFILETVTREGMMTVDEAPERSKGVLEVARRYGAEVLEWFFTTGDSDFIMKVEAADDEAISLLMMAVRRSGNVTARCLRAYSPEDWAGMVERL